MPVVKMESDGEISNGEDEQPSKGKKPQMGKKPET